MPHGFFEKRAQNLTFRHPKIKEKGKKNQRQQANKQTIKQNTKQITKNAHKMRALLEFGLSQGVLKSSVTAVLDVR